MKARLVRSVWLGGMLVSAMAREAVADSTVYFDASQVAVHVTTGVTSDAISSDGHLFTYTRDKLFTGGVGLTNPIGRAERVSWPTGVEAQAVTAGPSLSGAQLRIQRTDGRGFDLVSFSFKLLANTAGAGARLEIMPVRHGEDALNDPVFFEAGGYYGSQFAYNTSPGYLGSTAALTNFDAYKVSLYVDFALTALTLDAPPTNRTPTAIDLPGAAVLENEPEGTMVGTLTTIDPDAGDTFTYTLVPGPGDADNRVFSVSGGDLLTTTSFNYEVRSNYSVRVQSEDQGLLHVQQALRIDVLDVDETPVLLDLNAGASGTAVLAWTSVTNHLYALHVSTNLASGFSVLESNITATPALNIHTDSVPGGAVRFWRVTTVP